MAKEVQYKIIGEISPPEAIPVNCCQHGHTEEIVGQNLANFGHVGTYFFAIFRPYPRGHFRTFLGSKMPEFGPNGKNSHTLVKILPVCQCCQQMVPIY